MYNDRAVKRILSEEQKHTAERLLSEVGNSRYRAVSFKMQDVLVLTPFSEECDLFLFMEDDFALYNTGNRSFTEMRMAAEEAALKKEEVYTRVTLEKIYKIFAKKSGISPEGKERLMQRECELIEYFSFPRECGKELFRKAKDTKKKAVIISESIYPRRVVENILKNCGYSAYDMLITVSDIADNTAESWYEKTLEKAKISSDRLLHVGSNVAFDIELPIVKGSKALLLAPVKQLMEKSGRVSGYIKKKHIYEYDTQKYLTFHCSLGLYAAYGFDYPQNKTALSDFCADPWMIGFLALGVQELNGDASRSAVGRTALIYDALRKDAAFLDGKDDLDMLMDRHFGDSLKKYGTEGCGEILEFLSDYCASCDREFFKPYFSTNALKKWGASVKEPEIIPFSRKDTKDNALYRLADRMFPPGTRVRNIVDGIMTKAHMKHH